MESLWWDIGFWVLWGNRARRITARGTQGGKIRMITLRHGWLHGNMDNYNCHEGLGYQVQLFCGANLLLRLEGASLLVVGSMTEVTWPTCGSLELLPFLDLANSLIWCEITIEFTVLSNTSQDYHLLSLHQGHSFSCLWLWFGDPATSLEDGLEDADSESSPFGISF